MLSQCFSSHGLGAKKMQIGVELIGIVKVISLGKCNRNVANNLCLSVYHRALSLESKKRTRIVLVSVKSNPSVLSANCKEETML